MVLNAFKSYIDVLMRRKTSNFEEVMRRQNPRLQHDRKPVPDAFFGRRKMQVECPQMHVGEMLVVKHQPTLLFCLRFFSCCNRAKICKDNPIDMDDQTLPNAFCQA